MWQPLVRENEISLPHESLHGAYCTEGANCCCWLIARHRLLQGTAVIVPLVRAWSSYLNNRCLDASSAAQDEEMLCSVCILFVCSGAGPQRNYRVATFRLSSQTENAIRQARWSKRGNAFSALCRHVERDRGYLRACSKEAYQSTAINERNARASIGSGFQVFPARNVFDAGRREKFHRTCSQGRMEMEHCRTVGPERGMTRVIAR